MCIDLGACIVCASVILLCNRSRRFYLYTWSPLSIRFVLSSVERDCLEMD